ncbi:hypothetical protein BDV06DRAFT_221367 [Aspergillus oleicola]
MQENLPLIWDLATSQPRNLATSQEIQFNVGGNSWWSSTYIHASDGRDYFPVSHIGNPQQYSLAAIELDPITNHIHGAKITLPMHGFEAVGDDTLKGMRTWSTAGIEFNITFNFSSRVIVNGGTGTFTWGPFWRISGL